MKQGRKTNHELAVELHTWIVTHPGKTLLEMMGLSATRFKCSNCGRVAPLDRMEWSGPDGWVHANKVECYLFDRDYRKVA